MFPLLARSNDVYSLVPFNGQNLCEKDCIPINSAELAIICRVHYGVLRVDVVTYLFVENNGPLNLYFVV